MYPRNNASPPTIVVGTIYLNADGTIQTSGVSVSVSVGEVAEAAGGGTIAFGANSNAVYYTPTQAETDAESFKVVAFKAACTSASVTVLTDVNTPHIRYAGSHGPGVYIDDAAANTNTVFGTDGTYDNPVSTIAAATTLAGSLGSNRIYVVNDSAVTLAQTYSEWEFIGFAAPSNIAISSNFVNFGGQDVSATRFINLGLGGSQTGAGRFAAINCVITSGLTLNADLNDCTLDGANTIGSGATLMLHNCGQFDGATPTLAFSGGSGTCFMQGFSGRVAILTMAAGDEFMFIGNGQMTINGTGGTALISSDVLLTDLSGAAITISRGHTLTMGVDGTKLNLNQLAGWPRTLQEFQEAILTVTVDDATFAPTTTTFETDQTDNDPAEWTNQALLWATGANAGTTVFVTAYDFQNTKVKLTVSTMQTAPSDGDTFQRMGRSA